MNNIDKRKWWYCVLAKRKQERVAAGILSDRNGFDICAPYVRYRKKTRRGPVWFEEAMFPGYIFVYAYADELRYVRSSAGVKKILTFSGIYAVVPDSQMQILFNSVDEDQVRVFEDPLATGEQVEITAGPLQGMEGLVQNIMPSRQRVSVLVEMLGHWVRTELPEEVLIRRKN